jgi:hypothetical protein
MTDLDIRPRRFLKELAEAARKLDEPPRYEADNRVRCRGGRLSKIFWQGRQWAVTAYGVECRDGSYAIETVRLWEDEDRYGWVRHMGDKEWVDLPDFAEALRIARRRAAAAGKNRKPRKS